MRQEVVQCRYMSLSAVTAMLESVSCVEYLAMVLKRVARTVAILI